jgi:hypothetical protein
MQFSTIPILIAVIFGFIWFITRRLQRLGIMSSPQRDWIAALLTILLSWAILISYQSSAGSYAVKRLLDTLPGYWLPYVPVVITILLMLLNAPLRQALRILVDGTPEHWLTGIQIIRVLALGTLIKAAQGQFPPLFAWFVGLPDLLFGLSAIGVTWLAQRGRLREGFLLYWHLLGALVILVPMLGFMHLFMREALFAKLFAFPMIFAPALVVPTLVMLNMLVAWRLWESARPKP